MFAATSNTVLGVQINDFFQRVRIKPSQSTRQMGLEMKLMRILWQKTVLESYVLPSLVWTSTVITLLILRWRAPPLELSKTNHVIIPMRDSKWHSSAYPRIRKTTSMRMGI
jgi:hypothetical protein